ncbi:unnamed protein product [Chrysoparadoxa australica]
MREPKSKTAVSRKTTLDRGRALSAPGRVLELFATPQSLSSGLSFPLLQLPQDLLFLVLEFCDHIALTSTSQVCHATRQAACNERLWNPLCLKPWGLKSAPPEGFGEVSYRGLFPLIEPFPREFDPLFFGPGLSADEDCTLVRFDGRVGISNRCVRTDIPFPSTLAEERQAPAASPCRAPTAGPINLFKSWLVNLAQASGQCPASIKRDLPRPRTLPFSVLTTRPDGRVDVSPRLVAYFELEILPGAVDSQLQCVVIGLSSSGFCLRGKMPGWDSASYGYHGDDGGIFHSNGTMQRQYGEPFGPGDTVGAGVDYSNGDGKRGNIFFTKNGRNLGVAFADVTGAFYPTVGIDSSAPVRLNLGARPFMYDLQTLLAQHKSLVQLHQQQVAPAVGIMV